MAAYYNEFDPYAARWLRNLIVAGHIAPGDVDERPIQEVKAEDLKGYKQAHFFAGIGGWSYALRLADWPDDRPVWTGSCPCQPFSRNNPSRLFFADPRHLWPYWFPLIRECRPSTVFGEQVAAATDWLDLVACEMDSIDYAFGAALLPASAVRAAHERERIWFVADANTERWENAARVRTSAKSRANGWASAGVVHRELPGEIRWSPQPDQDWVVDGVPGGGNAVSAFGNAIYPPCAAQFIKAFQEYCL